MQNPTASSLLRVQPGPNTNFESCFGPTEGLARLGAPQDPAERVTIRNLKPASSDLGVVVDVTLESISPAVSIRTPAGQADISHVATIIDVSSRHAAEGEAARLRDRLAESEAARSRLTSLQAQLVEPDDQPVMVGSSAALSRVRSAVGRVAPTDTTVLIQGETGSGKELVARLVHAESPRARGAFVAVNCAALPESLIESELFGHERGAFTGADRRKLGKFEVADGGTIFLDEIAELPLAAQAKLLRVLQGGAFERVGGTETVTTDARVVAATHRDLARRVERGLFREDLYYRLNVFRIDVPPLRERREDLRLLIEHLHARIAKRLARPVLPLSDRSLRRVMAYRWPGNIRELANAVERATLLADGPELEIEIADAGVPVTSGEALGDRAGGSGGHRGAGPLRDVLLDLSLEQLQRLHIMHTLESCGHRVFGAGGAAAKLDINPQTLLSRMDKFGIPRPRTARAARGGGE
ncbi:MAG: sigma-54 interaction domain-containing protein [Phycisphaerales bacterium]